MKTVKHATADNLTFEQLTERAHTIIRPNGQKIYTGGYTRRMFNKDAKTPATKTCRACSGNGVSGYDRSYTSLHCTACGGDGFLFH
jgi:DnaJ-class molecular chaperone